MFLRYTRYCIILSILVIVTKGLLVQGNAVNLTDAIHGSPGNNVDPADIVQRMQIMMQMLLNQTAEIEHLKQQTAKIEILNQQSEKDRSTIQMLQNRVFFLEAGLNELSKLPSSQEFSTYLSGMNHLTQNSVENEAIVNNLTQQLLSQNTEMENLRQQLEIDRSTIQQLNGSLIREIRDVHYQTANNRSKHAFSAGISSSNPDWSSGTLVFPDVIYSKGTSYNPSTGIFTAPTAGTYVFYVCVQSGNNRFIQLDIVLNGSNKVQAMAWYNSGDTITIYQTGSNLVILHLQTGDRVWVRHRFGTGYFSDSSYATTFSGFKLY